MIGQISTRSSCSSEPHNLVASWLINQSPALKIASLQTKKLHTISVFISQSSRLSEGRSTDLHSYPAKFVAKSVPCRPVCSDTRGLTRSRGFNSRLNSAVSSFPLNLHMNICGEIQHAEHHGISAGGKSHAVTEASCNSSSSDRDQNVDETVKATIPGIACPSMLTVGKSTNIVWQECMVKKEERQKLLQQKGCVIWITGLSGSGKSTLACALDHALLKRGNLSYILDGDNLRHGLNKNIGFSVEDRAENIRRIGEVAKLFVDAGIICIASVISPYRKDRDACRQLLQEGEFIEVYMNFPLTLCEERDPKGLYKLARAGKIRGFTGVDDPYEAPLKCEVVMEPIDGRCPTPAEMAAHMVSFLEDQGLLGPPRYS